MAPRNAPVATPTPTQQRPPSPGPLVPGNLTPLKQGSSLPVLVLPQQSKINLQKGNSQFRLKTLGGQFRFLVLLCIAVFGISLVTSFLILSNTQERFRRIILDSAPSIISALQLGQAVEAADTSATDYQLASRVDVSSPDYDAKNLDDRVLRKTAWDTFLKQRQEIEENLYAARSNITFPGEIEAISTISTRFLEYLAQISVMRYEQDQGHREAALAAYKSAHDILVGNLGNVSLDDKGRGPEEVMKLQGWTGIVPSKDCLIEKPYLGIEANIEKLTLINQCQLKLARDDANSAVDRNILGAFIITFFTIGLLLFLGFRSAVITHRLVNPGYFLALLISLGFCIPLILFLIQAKEDYRVVARDSFESIEAAAAARQYAADANADEARLLLSPDGLGLDTTNPVLTGDVRRAFKVDTLTENFDKKKVLILQQVKITWNNVTYPSEREALCKVTQNPDVPRTCSRTNYALDDYFKIDTQIRQNFNNRLLAEAIKLEKGKSTEAYTTFYQALQDLSKVNEADFDKSACRAIGKTRSVQLCSKDQGYLPLLEAGALVAFPLLALTVIAGYIRARPEF